MRLPARIAIGAAALGVLTLGSLAYISEHDWWSLRAQAPKGWDFARAAMGYGLVFWAICGAFLFYLLRLHAFGRAVFLGVGATVAVLLALAWPGFFMSDSFSAVSQGAFFPINTWLGPYTAIVTLAVLHHIPALGALAAFQAAFFALAVAYGAETLRRRAPPWAVAAFLVMTMTSAPILHTALLVTRDSWFAVLSVLLVAECIQFFDDPDWRNGRTAGRILCLGVVGYFLRSDGLLYLALAGAVMAGRWLYDWRLRGAKTPLFAPGSLLAAVLPCLVIANAALLTPLVALPSYAPGKSYDVTLWLNPVGYVINHEGASIDPADLAAVSAVVPLWRIRGANDDTGINAFWDSVAAGDLHAPRTGPENTRVQQAVKRILLQHPDAVLLDRIKMFVATNYLSEARNPVFDDYFVGRPMAAAAMIGWPRTPAYHGLHPALRRAAEQAILATTRSPIGRFQWAFWPEMVALALLLLLVRAQPGVAFGAAMLLARAPLLALLAPEAQFKYWAAIEMAAPLLVAAGLPAVWGALRGRARPGAQAAVNPPLSRT